MPKIIEIGIAHTKFFWIYASFFHIKLTSAVE